MIDTSRLATRLRSLGLALFLSACASMAVAPLVHAEEVLTAPVPADTNPATNGELLVHGNYCGVGSHEGSAPIDALDVACMHHDACTPAGGIPDCACNARLREEATAIVASSDQSPEIKLVASATASAAAVMVCSPIGAISPSPASR